MDYAYKTEDAINELLKFKINFSETYNTYLFNGMWINEINESYYSEKIVNIKRLLHKQLKNGLKQEEYLQNLLDLIWKKVEYIEKFKCFSTEFFELYSEKITSVNYVHKEPNSNNKLFEIYKAGSKNISSQAYELFNFLNFHSEKLNDFQTPLDFERGFLLYTINAYREAIKSLYSFIYTIHMNAEFTDFKNLKFEEFSTKKKSERICHINLDKKSVAHLFRILLEEDYLVFNEANETNNRLEMKRFVEDNFTYQNAKKERRPIETFNREYSEVSSSLSPEVKKHKEFIDKLILKLQDRKNKLKD